MSRSLNKITIIGNVGADPEVRETDGGRVVANFSVATTAQWKDAKGDKQEKTEWHRCTAWGPLAENVIEKYVRKGDKLYVEGRVEYRQWTDRDNQTRYSTDIIVNEVLLLGSPKGNDNARSSARPRDDDRRPNARDASDRERERAAEGDDREDFRDEAGGEYEGPDEDRAPSRSRSSSRSSGKARSSGKSRSSRGGRR